MKQLSLTLLFALFISPIFAQQNCDEIKTELNDKNEIINLQNNNISQLEKDIEYYKEALGLLNSKTVVKQDGFILKINSVTGISNNGVIIIEGLVENKNELRALRKNAYKTIIYDSKGNNYKAAEVKFGNFDHLQEFQKDLPVKFTITFRNITEEMPVINNLTAIFTNRTGKEYEKMIFKNLTVNWD